MLEASELARLHFGGGRVAFAPTCQNLTCEHCMRSESETNDAPPPQAFNWQLLSPLDNFSK